MLFANGSSFSTCKDLQRLLVLCDNKLNIFGFWQISLYNKDI